MKLRNKKTGKVFDVIVREKSNGGGEYSIIVCNLRALRSGRSVSSILGEYDSLAKLNEEWEDYKPAEPLIKDEKVRKAVRAWAEAIGATKNIVFDGNKKVYSFYYENNKGGFEKLLIYGDNDLEELKRYTIAELCGEEEE